MQEETLYRRWQGLARSGKSVHTAGHRLRVLQAGRLNTWRGPDFIAARFELDGVVYQGDVECHLRTQDWYRHQHHLDRAFSQVVLHVVGAEAVPEAVEHRINGRAIPTLPLPELPPEPFAACPFRRLAPGTAPAILQALALERYRRKMRRFAGELARGSLPAVFHEAFLRAMGYAHNGAAFARLAGRTFLPPAVALSFSAQQLYALYAGQAGFLSVPADSYSAQLSRLYLQQRLVLPQAPLPADIWQFNGHRAGNHPHFRLAGALSFFRRYGWRPQEFLFGLLSRRRPYGALQTELQQFFVLPCDDYWQSHYALGRPMAQGTHRCYFGAARVAEIILNVVLPLHAALAQAQGSTGFAAYLEEVYLNWPMVNGYGLLQRQFPWWRQAQRLWPAQALNQALLELQQGYCLTGESRRCPLFKIPCPVIDSQSKNDYTLPVPNGSPGLSEKAAISLQKISQEL